MLLCLKCNRRKRVKTALKKQNRKEYWVSYCLTCGTPIQMDDKDETGTKEDRKEK